MKKIGKYLLLLFIAFVMSLNSVDARDYSFNSADEYHISAGDFVIGTHLYTASFASSATDFSDKAILYGASSIEANTINDVEMLMSLGERDSMYDTLTDSVKDYEAGSTIFITHVNGLCVDASCRPGSKVTVTFSNNGSTAELEQSLNLTVDYNTNVGFTSAPVPSHRIGTSGYYWALEDSDEPFEFPAIITNDITLELRWKDLINYKFIYHTNFGTDVVKEMTECTYDINNPEGGCKILDYQAVFGDEYNNDGYNFLGWSKTAKVGSVKYKAEDDVSKLLSTIDSLASEVVIDLYASWGEDEYSIEYDLAGGYTSNLTNIQYTYTSYDSNIPLFAPIRNGYKFEGWKFKSEIENETSDESETGDENEKDKIFISSITADDIPHTDIELVAVWSPNKYNFVYNDEIIGECEYDKECNLVSPEEITGKEFKNWVTVEKGINLPSNVTNYTVGTPENLVEIQVEPKYSDNVYSIRYDYDGGKVSSDNISTIKYNDTITLNSPTKAGYRFTGWKMGDSEELITNGELTGIDEDINLTAVYEPVTISIEFYNEDTQEGESITCTYRDEENLCSAMSALENDTGKYFEAWVYNGKLYDADSLLSDKVELFDENVETIVLKAKWTTKGRNIINYSLNGGTLEANAVRGFTENEVIQLPQPSRVGYNFAGWYLNDSDEIYTSENNEFIGGSEDIKLTASWDAITYNITLHKTLNDDGTWSDDDIMECHYDEECTLNTVNDLDDFIGWAKDKNTLALYYGDGLTVKNLAEEDGDNIDLYAVTGSSLVDYYISLIDEYGNPVTSNLKYKAGEVVDLNTFNPSADNYNFIEWQLNGEPVSGNITISSNMILTAIFEPIEYNITYQKVTDGYGAIPETLDEELMENRMISYTVEDKKIIFSLPDDNDEITWKKILINGVDKQLENREYVYDIPYDEQLDDITVTFVYGGTVVVNYTVTFDADGGLPKPAKQTIKENGKVNKPNDPSKDGFKFMGWLRNENDSEYYDFDTPVTEDIDLIAKWEKIYNITYRTVLICESSDCMEMDEELEEINDLPTTYTISDNELLFQFPEEFMPYDNSTKYRIRVNGKILDNGNIDDGYTYNIDKENPNDITVEFRYKEIIEP